MKEHIKNGLAVAKILEQHSLVKQVLYPGFPSHPQHKVVLKQAGSFSGMSFYMKGGIGEVTRFLQAISVLLS